MTTQTTKSAPAAVRARAEAAPTGPVRRRTQAERSEETKRRLLDAAAKVLSERGYAGLRTAEISRVAGVSRGAQLHHFPSKDELVLATLRDIYARGLERGRNRASAIDADADPIETIIADASDFFFSEEFFIGLDIVMSAGKDQALRQEALAVARGGRLPLEEIWVEALTARGIPAPLATDLLWLTLAIVRGLAIRTLWQDERDRFRRLYDLWRDMVRGYLTTHLAAAGDA